MHKFLPLTFLLVSVSLCTLWNRKQDVTTGQTVERRCGRVVRMLDFGAEGSNPTRAKTVHRAVNVYLNIVGEGKAAKHFCCWGTF